MGSSRSKKTILREISEEIEKGIVEEQNLERLEILEEILREEGSPVPESMKEAYCQVAVECTARYLVCAKRAKNAYIEAMRRIWIERVMVLCQRDCCLVTSELKSGCQRLQAAISDPKTCETLIQENTRNRALLSLDRLVSELLLTMDCDTTRVRSGEVIVEAGEKEKEIQLRSRATKAKARGKEILEEDTLPRSIHACEQPKTPVKLSDSAESDAEPSVPRIKTIPTPVFERVLGELRASKHELMDALRKAGASMASIETTTKEKNVSGNPSTQNNASKPSMMERNSTAHTCEWEDSIDDSSGQSSSHGGRACPSSRKRLVVSPLRRKQTSQVGRSMKVPWTTAETLAVLRGYESLGAKWKEIKAANPIILARRTNIDIKDKFRNVMGNEKTRRQLARLLELGSDGCCTDE